MDGFWFGLFIGLIFILFLIQVCQDFKQADIKGLEKTKTKTTRSASRNLSYKTMSMFAPPYSNPSVNILSEDNKLFHIDQFSSRTGSNMNFTRPYDPLYQPGGEEVMIPIIEHGREVAETPAEQPAFTSKYWNNPVNNSNANSNSIQSESNNKNKKRKRRLSGEQLSSMQLVDPEDI